MPPQTPIYQIRITLRYSDPPIWRRVQVRGNTSLDRLHEIIQIAMGWTDSHLHQFIVGETYIGPLDVEYDDLPMGDETRVKLNQVAQGQGSAFLYEYDFGDSWLHDLLVEQIAAPERGVQYPVCIAGSGPAHQRT